jgi:hypothetical protein
MPVVVGAQSGENPDRRKGKGFRTTVVSPELVGPKQSLNTDAAKGKPVYIPVPRRYTWQHMAVR